MYFWDNQGMSLCHLAKIKEGKNMFIFINFCGRNFSIYDFTEYTLTHHYQPFSLFEFKNIVTYAVFFLKEWAGCFDSIEYEIRNKKRAGSARNPTLMQGNFISYTSFYYSSFLR